MDSRRLTLRATLFALLGVLVNGTPVAAQLAAPAPPGPYVIDLRGAVSGLPVDAAFYPAAPSDTIVPARGFGLDAGAHLYPMQLGIARLGIGAALLRVRGSASAVVPTESTSSSSSATLTTPDVHAVLTIVAPQLSFNFGTSAGWSYVSGGVGLARVTSTTSAFGTATDTEGGTPAGEADSGFRRSVNVGAGARWYAKSRLAVSFDLRVHVISAGEANGERPATPKATVTVASVGISVR